MIKFEMQADETIGSAIRRLRVEHGLKQTDIERLLSGPEARRKINSVLSKYESGQRMPSADNLMRIVRIINQLGGRNGD